MKDVLFNEFTLLYFLLLLLTHFLARKGRHDFAIKNKIQCLLPAAASALLTLLALAYCGIKTNLWMFVCLFNLGIFVIIITDVMLQGFTRMFVQANKLQRI